MTLDDLLQRAPIGRGGTLPPASVQPSGFAELDASLMGGWPQGALIEVLSGQRGIGEMQLLLPTLVNVSRPTVSHPPRWTVFVAPPYLPYAPALTQAGVTLTQVLLIYPHTQVEALWAVEQSLRSGACGAVLAWLQPTEHKHLRRLQLAAEAGGALGFLFGGEGTAVPHSPAAVRLRLEAVPAMPHALAVTLLKRRGGWLAGPIVLEMKHALAMSAIPTAGAGSIHARTRDA